MLFRTLPHSLLSLLALTALLSGLVVWGMADRLPGDQDQNVQGASLEECLSLPSAADDSTSDPSTDSLITQHPPFLLSADAIVSLADRTAFRARLAGDPALPRAPPA